ncbi:MAG: acetate--CoA ligase family protein, partial [Deltaproteobacteria bacterium]
MADAARPGSATANTLCEHASKALLADYGVPLARERVAASPEDAVRAAGELGYPVVLKLCGPGIAHKTERGLVRLDLPDAAAVRRASEALLALRRPEDGDAHLLLAERVRGNRELIAGLFRDPQFGPCVMLGLGGILAEALRDTVFAVAPLDRAQARRMIDGLRARDLFARPFRGEPALDADALAEALIGLGRLGLERSDVESVDVNPLIACGDRPIAVDALVELRPGAARAATAPRSADTAAVLERFRPLFHPRGIAIAGVSSHPGKFGFVAFHNLLRFGYRGDLFPLNREGVEILGHPTLRDASQLPEGRADLVFVCTPNQVNVELLRTCAKAGVRAAFVASGGYGEAGAEGRARERELVDAANELGMLLAGPNGQGVISTAESMCAQIVAPYPPAGRISVVSQSGNLVSALLNYAVETGVGISKAISAGNSAQTSVADYLEYFGADPETGVGLAYLEGIADGPSCIEAIRRFTATKPLVLVKGGVGAEGQR